MTRKDIEAVLKSWGILLTEKQHGQLDIYAQELFRVNAHMNLLSPRDEKIIWERHILDSLAAAPLLRKYLKSGTRIADTGTGAGFPGIPLAAALPEYSFDLIDSIGKRCVFLENAIKLSGLNNARVLNRRVGEGPKQRIYGAVTERAMGKLEKILNTCFNICISEGIFAAWQSSSQLSSPRPEVSAAMKKTGVYEAERFEYRLPLEEESRYIIIFAKRSL